MKVFQKSSIIQKPLEAMTLDSKRWIALLSAGFCLAAFLGQTVTATLTQTTTEEWSQWRGPNRDSQVFRATWPKSLGDDLLKLQWSVELGEGYASPVLTDQLVFSVETRDKQEEVIRAFDRYSGTQIWEYVVPGAMKVPFFAAKNGSWARSTPATDGIHLYALSMTDILSCLEVNTGKLVWQLDFKKREGTQVPTFGGVSSPLIDGDYLYVQGGHAAAKLDRSSSENLWRVLEDRRGMFGGSFSSPVMATIHGIRQFVVQTRSTLAGVDPESGKILWSTMVEASRGMNILTPVVKNNHIFTATYGGGSFCFEIKKEGESLLPSLVWENNKLEGYMTSPIVVGDYLYHHGRDQKLYCIDFFTGNTAWVSDRKFGQYWSMVANGSTVLALDQKGDLILFDASPTKFTIVDERSISREPTWAHLAISRGQLFVRGLNDMTAYSWIDD